ncbi:MAG: glycoside hydrolase family 2 protein [Actinobacteria bacterium]|nr:glycoside hydrolase family 2 protein [Actinomycetota bacterium]
MAEAAAPPARVRVDGHLRQPLEEGWEAASCAPDAHADPAAAGATLAWHPARVPGTAAAVLRDAGAWRPGEPAPDLDAHDWWFRTRFDAAPAADGEQVVLALDGIATVAEVFLNGERVLESESMFTAHALDVGGLLRAGAPNELAIRCRALAPLLTVRRRPRARWRTKLVDGNLRWFRTMLLGRAPGFAPGPAAVGPWRPVRLERRRALAVEVGALAPWLDGDVGVLALRARLRALDGVALEAAELELAGPSGAHRAQLALAPAGAVGTVELHGELRVADVARWWPHTHGEPALHDVRVHVTRAGGGAPLTVALGRTGFRTLSPGPSPDHDVERDGLSLHVNGVPLFARGAIWTPADFVTLAPDEATLRRALEQVCDAGMNVVRIPGTGAYESPAFHDLCDELGILVWQDMAFANLDYPIADERFRATVAAEVAQVLGEAGGRPSLAVVCGNSEVEQQVAMLGLDPALGRGELFGELLPDAVAAAPGVDAVYVPSAPSGGELPFRNDRGVAHYFGVGGYRRPLDDARRAGVRFAAECLAFSNVPDEAGVTAALPQAPAGVGHDPRWKAGVPRDAATSWDFEDVRDHYLHELFGVDPLALRAADPERWLELGRAVTGEAMAEVFGEWRRADSPCAGGIVLWLRDLVPGAGWGLVDHAGTPKAAYHHLRRALAPVAVWTTDEGLNGIRVHVANDRAEPLRAQLRVALYRDGEQRVAEASATLELGPHATAERDVEALLGRFADASYAYRFGPPPHDAIVASLERDDGAPLARTLRFPAGRPLTVEPPERLGLEAHVSAQDADAPTVVVRSTRVAYGVRVHAGGFDAEDDAFTLEPGIAHSVRLRPRAPGATFAGAALSALNARGLVRVETAPEER